MKKDTFIGKWGDFGGRFVPETLVPALEELEKAYMESKEDRKFQKELSQLLMDYAGRPSPLYFAKRMSKDLGVKVYLKREDLNHTGSHKINNTLGQALLAKRMKKKRIIAETGAGQHGVATATASSLLGFPCDIYMGEEDMRRQRLNVFRMKLLGSRVIPVRTGSRTLKDAINEALRDWVTHVEDTYYLLGSVVGPHPYPVMVRDFQSVIGREARQQILEKEGRLPHLIVACVGGGSNSIGIFYPFLEDEVELVGVEAGGKGNRPGEHGASLSEGKVGILHGAKSFILQDEDGQILPTHSIAAGLDYPGVGPEHAYLKEVGRVKYYTIQDREAVEAFLYLSKMEGILPALESAHAVAWVLKNRQSLKGKIVIINLSGNGDKDVYSVAEYLGEKL